MGFRQGQIQWGLGVLKKRVYSVRCPAKAWQNGGVKTKGLKALLSLTLLSACGASSLSCLAQRPEETGTVIGRVIASDTNGPARLASVLLIPTMEPVASPSSSKAAEPADAGPARPVEQTGLDGTFSITRVRPGTYYVVAEKAGYLAPLSMFTRSQLNKPDEATAKVMARLLTPVTVTANRSTAVEVRMQRGAALSGNVLYDDGSPASGVLLRLWQRDKEGKWVQRSGDPVGGMTQVSVDDQGHYRFAGLPEGEYLLQADVLLQDVYVNGLFGSSASGWSSNTRYSLNVFYGDAYRTSKAKAVRVGDAEERHGLDLTIRLAEMHKLSGSVLAPDGHVANAASVALLWNDDKSELVSTSVRAADNTFSFDFVPDGEYTLRVTDARDVTRVDVPNCPNCVPPFHTEDKTVRTFGSAEQPVVLHTDVQALTVTVQPAAAAAAK